MNTLRHLLLAPFVWLLALIFLLEELIWDNTAALMARLTVIRLIHRLEQRIQAFPPRWALLTFLLPSLILIPAKLLGLHALAAGHWLTGSAVLLAAKLLGMAFFSRIFNLTRPALLQLPWFVRLYEKVMLYRNRIHHYLAEWPAYQTVKRVLHRQIQRLKGST